MGGDGQESVDLQREVGTHMDGTQSGCIVAGCECRDGRIVPPRRARFHAYLARERGETADRVIGPDPDWQLPGTAIEEN
jgi:hypothetical protein